MKWPRLSSFRRPCRDGSALDNLPDRALPDSDGPLSHAHVLKLSPPHPISQRGTRQPQPPRRLFDGEQSACIPHTFFSDQLLVVHNNGYCPLKRQATSPTERREFCGLICRIRLAGFVFFGVQEEGVTQCQNSKESGSDRFSCSFRIPFLGFERLPDSVYPLSLLSLRRMLLLAPLHSPSDTCPYGT